MKNGMFDLGNFTESTNDEVLDTPINEEGEFASNSNATNDVDNHLTDAKVSVPADKNYSSIWDCSISVPDGLSETPKAKPYDAASIPVPQGTELTTDEWNKAMSALKQSFKEGYELMGMLESMKIVEKSKNQIQQELMDNAMYEAMLQSIEDGPFFEEVDRSDKNEIKAIVRKIRRSVKKVLADYDMEFGSMPALVDILAGGGLTRIWNTRLWQYVGVTYCESGNINKLMDKVNEELSDQLGEYKLLHVPVLANIVDIFRLRLGWKTNKQVYMLVVDRELTKETKDDIKKVCKEMETTLKSDKAEDKTDKEPEKSDK